MSGSSNTGTLIRYCVISTTTRAGRLKTSHCRCEVEHLCATNEARSPVCGAPTFIDTNCVDITMLLAYVYEADAGIGADEAERGWLWSRDRLGTGIG